MDRKFGIRVVGVAPQYADREGFAKHIGNLIKRTDGYGHIRDEPLITDSPIKLFNELEKLNKKYIFEIQQLGEDENV